tara:strand:- start:294 stop:935 length:642 start_codon:yes stop_codon:yes gene_type:complete
MTAERILLATGNAKKAKELKDILGPGFDVGTLAEAELLSVEIIEDAPTFEGNARIKVDAIRNALAQRGQLSTYYAILGDDSGICVDILDGEPGVRSARFASDNQFGEGDADNNRLLLSRLKDIPPEKRTASFSCALCLYLIQDDEWFNCHGYVHGVIASQARGDNGFGYDPLFIPNAYPNKHMAELQNHEKHAISHRGVALKKIADILLQSLS